MTISKLLKIMSVRHNIYFPLILLILLAVIVYTCPTSAGKPLINFRQISDDSTDNRDPFIFEDTEGYLNLAWMLVDNSDPDGDIYFSRSPDGIDWGAPIQITTYNGKDKSPIFTEGDDGRLYLAFSSTRDDEGQGTSGDIYLTISDDNGDTWSTPSYVAGKYPHGEGAGGVVVDGDTIWIAYHEAYGDDIIQYVIKSTNGGQTWQSPVQISSNSIVNSGSMIQDSDGSLLLTFAKESDEFFKVLRSSNGQSWSEISSQKLYTAPEKMDLIIDDDDIYWLVTYSVRDGDSELFITKSDDLVDWGPLNRLTYEDAVDRYPSIVVTSGGELGVYWESDRDGVRQIYAGTIDYDDDYLAYDYPCIYVDELGKHYMVMRNQEDIWFSKSLDGLEWSEPTPLSTESDVERTPRITKGDDGTLYVTFSSRKSSSSGRVWFTRSYDDGANWETPKYIAGNSPDGNGPNGIAFLPNGPLLITWHRAVNSGHSEAKYITSDDYGDTWNNAGLVTSRNIASRNLFSIDKEGNALMVVNDRSSDRFYFLESSDGENWNEIGWWDGANSKVTEASIYQNSEGIYWLAWRLEDNGDEIWYSTSDDLESWSAPTLIDNESKSPFIYANSNKMKASLAWATKWEDGYRLYFMQLNKYDSKVNLPIKLHPAMPNIAFVRGGESINFNIIAEVKLGPCYNVSLILSEDIDELNISIKPIRSRMNTGDNITFIISLVAPHVDDPSNEIRIWVRVHSDEADSNKEQLILIYKRDDASDDEGIAGFSTLSIMMGASIAGVVATSFRGNKPQKP